MDRSDKPRLYRTRWAALAAGVVLVLGVGLAAREMRSPRAVPPRGPAPAGAETTADPIPRALKQAGGEDEKSRWVDNLAEVDLLALDARKREIFLRIVNTRRCTCGCGYTLAGCRTFDATCDKSLPRVKAAYDSVVHGWIADASGMRERPPAEPSGRVSR